MTAPHNSQPGSTSEPTSLQQEAAAKMALLEQIYGRTFLLNSLHQVRFDYQALQRVARGIDP